ncbi:MAG: ATP-binding cassette domain-containing protein [Desulfobacterium sp.]|jgi:molybdate transport system ATP-binding protein|nr:ATP-binding cassette domain-containing protein [Desulfobacterium sp.]
MIRPDKKPLFQLRGASISLMGNPVLEQTDWRVKKGEHWLVTGPNGSGKTTLLKAVAGTLPICAGSFTTGFKKPLSQAVVTVSMDLERQILDDENTGDFARYFSGSTSCGTRVSCFLNNQEGHRQAQDPAQLPYPAMVKGLLNRTLRDLSTGEMKMVMIARAMITRPEILILDEPFEGLDAEAGNSLSALMEDLASSNVTLVVSTHRFNTLPSLFTHRIHLNDLSVESTGPIKGLPPEDCPPGHALNGTTRANQGISFNSSFNSSPRRPQDHPGINEKNKASLLVKFDSVTIRYGDVTALSNLSWELHQGENWLIRGANGSGKSTLAELIYGDNPQAYANKIEIFGRQRGAGDSIWEIKRRMGFVSNRLQLGFPGDSSILSTVISGFFDSAGLFRAPSRNQQILAEHCLETLGIRAWAGRKFGSLSTGQQRLVLLARALVKTPDILIMDELCAGLDRENRRQICNRIETLGHDKQRSMIYITHHDDEIPKSMDRLLELSRGKIVL